MNNRQLLLITLSFVTIIFTSCVSTKKYQAALSREQGLMAERDELNNNIKQLNSRIGGLESDPHVPG
jgi:outer membrane murein-binding lipoprotein Lpp